MKKSKFSNICLGILIGAAAIIVAMCVLVTVVPPSRSHKAQEYDLWCVTELKKNPLSECKESK